MDSVMANGNAFTLTSVHGKRPESRQFNAFDKAHQTAWVEIFNEGLSAYNNPDDHDSWETGSTASEFQDPIDIQMDDDDRLSPVIEIEENSVHEHDDDDQYISSLTYAHLYNEGIIHLTDHIIGGTIYKKGKSTIEPWKTRFMIVDIISGRILFLKEKIDNIDSYDPSSLRGQLEFKGNT